MTQISQLPDINKIIDSFIDLCASGQMGDCLIENKESIIVEGIENELSKIKSYGPEYSKLFLDVLLDNLGDGWYAEDIIYICNLLNIKEYDGNLFRKLPNYFPTDEEAI